MVQVTPELYNREEIDEMLDKKLNISDQIDAFTKQEDDALLLLKADKSELIDAYSMTEDDELLALKLNISDQIDAYTKQEDDELLALKLNISDQIDTYSKTEADTLIDDKLNIIDQIDAYTKQEDGALLLLKADKSELIDAYSKTEADALLDDKLNITDQIDAYSKQEDDALLLLKVDKSELIDAYTKQEVEALLDEKLNISDQIDAYNKQEADALLDDNLNITDQIDAYSKQEDDALLDDKLNITDQIDAYSKQEDDALLLLKADKSELADYVDLASTQTITGQKQFGIISVSCISKQNKNDASILLAGGGDMLVSSLVSQPQLQEVRDIASGKSKGYVFATTDQMNTWMEDQENVAKLAIGDNLYIVDKQVMDYWWDGSSLRALETELPDMSNVMTILGTATGGGNAITDLSFDGNTLILAKNSSFITTNYDESITGQKTFYTTIHSVGISVQNYENNSVVCAGGGDKSIQDINVSVDLSNYYNKSQIYSQTETDQKLNLKLNVSDQIDAYTKTQDDALLLLKADKTQLIDTYSKTEADALLDDKLNVSDQIDTYTKGEDDALLLLKADKTQLIDSYTKGETNNLLNSKADSGVSYTKGEDEAQLLLKADKTQLIDSYTKGEDNALLLFKADKTQFIDAYTKGETDNLLNNKANSGVSYTKGEDENLLLLKADKTQLIDSYTKGETNNLLNNKADLGVSYTKGEDDALLLLKANQSITYRKTETDQLISQIEVGYVDLSGYMTLGTSQTITANKTFNNAYRFVSSIDGMATITGSQFVKSGADDTDVLLGADGTKPISEFAGSPTDLSDYYTKTQTYSKTETDNKYVRLDGSIQQTIARRLKYVSPFGETYDETQDQVANTYLTQSEVDAKLTNYVNTTNNQEINGKDDSSVLLAGGGDQLLSSFGGAQVEDITSTFYTLMMEIIPKTQIAISTQTTICTVGSISNTITPPTPPSTIYPISLATNEKHQHVLIHIENSEQLPTQQKHGVLMMMGAYNLVGCFDNKLIHITYQTCLILLFLNYEMSYEIGSVYLDEALLEAAGLLEFPEYYVYIIERDQEPVPPIQRIPIEKQTLQKQVKDNDDILFSTNEEFVPLVSNVTQKQDLSSQLERSSFLASSGSDPQLIVYGDRVTLTASYETTGLFPNAYLFKSYPKFARPKKGDQVIAFEGHLLQAIGGCRQILLQCLISHIIKIMNRQRKQIMMRIMTEKQTLWTRGMQMEKVNLKPKRMSMKQ
ncbi:MAG: hypothetical protein EZS28_020173 [Streblomastix strix]|uniref:Uncharacterized protein n=1 Tax=Streblomastix strix TaxID=222440 RepID=A0A5J4VP53_9EUKA|nr:MAG: hypothetical protein EZS28_020173 [Streblomastix strix]